MWHSAANKTRTWSKLATCQIGRKSVTLLWNKNKEIDAKHVILEFRKQRDYIGPTECWWKSRKGRHKCWYGLDSAPVSCTSEATLRFVMWKIMMWIHVKGKRLPQVSIMLRLITSLCFFWSVIWFSIDLFNFMHRFIVWSVVKWEKEWVTRKVER